MSWDETAIRSAGKQAFGLFAKRRERLRELRKAIALCRQSLLAVSRKHPWDDPPPSALDWDRLERDLEALRTVLATFPRRPDDLWDLYERLRVVGTQRDVAMEDILLPETIVAFQEDLENFWLGFRATVTGKLPRVFPRFLSLYDGAWSEEQWTRAYRIHEQLPEELV